MPASKCIDNMVSLSTPGSILQARDIGNRLKTLLDCLHTPPPGQALELSATNSIEALFCTVLDDDASISIFSVKTIQDLRPSSARGDVLLLIEVK